MDDHENISISGSQGDTVTQAKKIREAFMSVGRMRQRSARNHNGGKSLAANSAAASSNQGGQQFKHNANSTGVFFHVRHVRMKLFKHRCPGVQSNQI